MSGELSEVEGGEVTLQPCMSATYMANAWMCSYCAMLLVCGKDVSWTLCNPSGLIFTTNLPLLL